MDLYQASNKPDQNFDKFDGLDSTSSEDQMYLSDINLSLTFFTGVNGSLDQLLSNKQTNNDHNTPDVSFKEDNKKREPQIQFKMKRSTSMTFNDEANQIQFGPILPLTQSSYDFLSNDQNSFYNSFERKSSKNRSPSGFIVIEDDDDINNGSNISLQEIHSSSKSRKKRDLKQTLFRELDDYQYTESFAEFMNICTTIKINPKKIGLLPLENWPDGEISFDQIVAHFFQRRTPSPSKQDLSTKNSSISKKKTKFDTSANITKANSFSILATITPPPVVSSLSTHPMNNALKLAIKLFDALKISEISPVYESLVGVSWFHCGHTEDDGIIRMNISRFARLIGISNGVSTNKNESEKIEPEKLLFEPSKGLLSFIGFKEMTLEQIVALDSNADLFGIDLVEVKLIYHPSHLFRKSSTMNEILSISE